MNTLSILVVVESILLVVLCGVLMYLIFGKGQVTTIDFYLARKNKYENFDKDELLKGLGETFTDNLEKAQKFKPNTKGKKSRSTRVYDPHVLGGVAFSPFVKVFEEDPETSSVYTTTMHNHVRTPETMSYDGGTHYSNLEDTTPIFNSSIHSRYSLKIPTMSSLIKRGTGVKMSGDL